MDKQDFRCFNAASCCVRLMGLTKPMVCSQRSISHVRYALHEIQGKMMHKRLISPLPNERTAYSPPFPPHLFSHLSIFPRIAVVGAGTVLSDQCFLENPSADPTHSLLVEALRRTCLSVLALALVLLEVLLARSHAGN